VVKIKGAGASEVDAVANWLKNIYDL
jgi:hypothetical protein